MNIVFRGRLFNYKVIFKIDITVLNFENKDLNSLIIKFMKGCGFNLNS